MKRTLPLILIVLAVFVGGLSMSFLSMRLIQRHAKQGNVVTAPEADPALATAEEVARRTLPDFLTKLKNGEVQGAIKVRFDTPTGPEYIWVDHIQELEKDKKTTFSGELADDPRLMAGKKKGDAVTFPLDDVVDWIARHKDGSIEGNYTYEVLRREGVDTGT